MVVGTSNIPTPRQDTYLIFIPAYFILVAFLVGLERQKTSRNVRWMKDALAEWLPAMYHVLTHWSWGSILLDGDSVQMHLFLVIFLKNIYLYLWIYHLPKPCGGFVKIFPNTKAPNGDLRKCGEFGTESLENSHVCRSCLCCRQRHSGIFR